MTLEEIKRSDKAFLTAADVAEVLRSDAQGIRYMAQHDPEALGFPVVRIRTRTKIPRVPFLRYLGEVE